MSYGFPPDLEQRVKARMISRGVPSEDDVLREAMDALDQLEEDPRRRWHERNEIASEQSRLGLSKPLDLESLFARVEERVSEQGE